jgi:hypothetical protein
MVNVTIKGGRAVQSGCFIGKANLAPDAGRLQHIIVCSGYPWEPIISPMSGVFPWIKTILEHVDVVVDGPFIQSLDDPFITYRGSRNQRPIDVEASLDEDRVVTLDWDAPEIVITMGGDALMPVGLAKHMHVLGEMKSTRCVVGLHLTGCSLRSMLIGTLRERALSRDLFCAQSILL